MELIKTVNLHKSFGDLKVLTGVNETIHKGEVVSIIGPSGGGKSTFLRCLNLLEQPEEGKIFFDGTEITGNLTREEKKAIRSGAMPKPAKVNIDIQTTGVISERRSNWPTNPNGYELAFSGFAPSTTDHTPAYGARYYTSHYPQRNAPHENAEADELYTKAINAATPEERYELTMQLEKALQKTMTAIPVVNGSSLVVYADHCVGAVDPETYTTGSGWLKNYADIVK